MAQLNPVVREREALQKKKEDMVAKIFTLGVSLALRFLLPVNNECLPQRQTEQAHVAIAAAQKAVDASRQQLQTIICKIEVLQRSIGEREADLEVSNDSAPA